MQIYKAQALLRMNQLYTYLLVFAVFQLDECNLICKTVVLISQTYRYLTLSLLYIISYLATVLDMPMHSN